VDGYIDRRLRILHCLRAPVGGLFRHVADLAEEQARRGHIVGVLCDSRSGDSLTEDRLDALKPHLQLGLMRTPMPRQLSHRDLTALRDTGRFALNAGADILHGHGAKGGAYARLAARSLRNRGHAVRCYYTPHGGSLHYDRSQLIGRAYLALEQRLARLSDGIIFESAYAQRTFDEKVGTDLAPARVIANGLRPDDFRAHAPCAGAADFLFVGELRRLKGVDVLLRALARVNARRPATALIVGAGPDADELLALAQELGLQDKVSFPGAMPVNMAFAQGRCLLVPSRAESLPYIVLEAGAAGLPVIATDVGGIPEIMAGSDTELVAAGDDAALAARMLDFLGNEAGANARSRRLRTRIAEHFSVATMTDAVVEFYRTRADVLFASPVR
jgi:glycosyltransferase involved in cell wall biosynthesis